MYNLNVVGQCCVGFMFVLIKLFRATLSDDISFRHLPFSAFMAKKEKSWTAQETPESA